MDMKESIFTGAVVAVKKHDAPTLLKKISYLYISDVSLLDTKELKAQAKAGDRKLDAVRHSLDNGNWSNAYSHLMKYGTQILDVIPDKTLRKLQKTAEKDPSEALTYISNHGQYLSNYMGTLFQEYGLENRYSTLRSLKLGIKSCTNDRTYGVNTYMLDRIINFYVPKIRLVNASETQYYQVKHRYIEPVNSALVSEIIGNIISIKHHPDKLVALKEYASGCSYHLQKTNVAEKD